MNETLPFFAYGIFKPGQLAHHQISDFVDYDRTQLSAIKGRLKERDGVPILVPGNDSKVKGYVVFFKPNIEHQAYNVINGFEPNNIYYWNQLHTIDGQCANVLIGKKPNKGCEELEHIEDWDGRDDPVFTFGLELVEEIIGQEKEWSWDYKSIFRMQMAYMLLWSAVERYATLRYGVPTKEESITQKLKKMASEPYFAEIIKKKVSRVGAQIVRSTDPSKTIRLDLEKPEKAMDYYYQVRSNAVHRGKVVNRDFNILKDSTGELLAIFKCVLAEAFVKSGHLAG